MKIRPIRNLEEQELVHKLAQQDKHVLAWPSHIVEKNDNIVGSLSIMPMVLVWMDTTKTNVRDSIQLMNTYESMISNTSRVICVPCVENSPYISYMPKVGYIDLGKINLFAKGI